MGAYRRRLGVIACVTAMACGGVAMAAGTPTFKGKTSQKKAIRFKFAAGRISGLHFTVNLTCSNGDPLTDTESGFQATKVSHGKFSDDQIGKTDEVKLRGRIKGKKASGKITVSDKISPSVTCGPQTVKFTARRR
jgi:hypothetical protein